MARSRHWWIAALVGLVVAGCGANTVDSNPTIGPSETAPIGAPNPITTTTAANVVEVATTVLPTTAVTAAPTTSTTIPAPCNVMFVSDSVGIDLVTNGLKDRLAYAGCTLKWTGGQRGIGVEDGARLLDNASEVDADIVVVMLGYHDANSNGRAGRYPGFIDTVMQAAGTRLVVWPMYAATDDCSKNYKSGIAMANQSLQDATARWPNLRLVDYPSHLAAHPEFSQNRCPHLLANGSKEVAGWLAGQIRETANSALAAG